MQSGKKIRCPDCHSDLVIPAPPAKKKQPDIQLDDQVASVRLSPVEGTNPRLQEGSGASAKTMLAKAAKDLEVERAEIDAVTGVFDSKAWLSQIFSFLSDRRVVIALVALGVVAAGCEYAAARFAIFPWIGKFILFPAYAGTFLCCLGVLPKAANREDKVEEWPFSHLGTYVGPMFVVLILWYVTYFIGWGIAAPFSGSFAFIREAIAETFQWGVLPILFIGILDTRSPIQPISMKVLQSMGSHSEAWGAMYMQTAMAWVGYFLLRQIGLVFSPQIAAIFGICLPLYLCFVANQYGILAARISDVTDLGFSGEYAEAE